MLVANNVACTFDQEKGVPISLTVNGRELMADAAKVRDRTFDHDQALIDNYMRHWKLRLEEFDQLKLKTLEKTVPSELTIEKGENHVTVTIKSSFRSSENAGFVPIGSLVQVRIEAL